MKRFLCGSLVALSLVLTASSARADVSFEYGCSRHFGYTRTSKNRCFSFNSYASQLPCAGGCPTAPAAWNALPAYAPPAVGYAAPVAAVPAAVAPTFKAPPPAPATNGATGLQQTGYFYYGQPNATGYDYNAGYNYGASYGYSYYGYAQAPNYWY